MVTILDERSFVFIWPPVPLHKPLPEIMRQQKSTFISTVSSALWSTSLTPGKAKVKGSGPETTREEHDFQVFPGV